MSVRLSLVALALALCACVRTDVEYPVGQFPVAGGTLSCKGSSCCWPWDRTGVSACSRVEGNPMNNDTAIIFYLRGRSQ